MTSSECSIGLASARARQAEMTFSQPCPFNAMSVVLQQRGSGLRRIANNLFIARPVAMGLEAGQTINCVETLRSGCARLERLK